MTGEGDEEELRKIKTNIRSLLIARTRPVSFEVLAKDYRDLVGKPLRYERFGYRTPYEFFINLTDTVQVVSSPWGFGLKAIPHESSKHISEMVAAQKRNRGARAVPSRKNFSSGYRRSYELKTQNDRPIFSRSYTLENKHHPIQEANQPPTQEANNRSPTQEASHPPSEEANKPPTQEGEKPPTLEANKPPTKSYDLPTQEASKHPTQEVYKPPSQKENKPPTQEENKPPILETNNLPTQEANKPPDRGPQPSTPKTDMPESKTEAKTDRHHAASQPAYHFAAVPRGYMPGQHVRSPLPGPPPMGPPNGFNMMPYYLFWSSGGLPPPYPMMPYPWMSWFPNFYPEWPSNGMWDATDQNLKQLLDNHAMSSTTFHGLTDENHPTNREKDTEKEIEASFSSLSQICQPASSENEPQRFPAGYSDDESNPSFCQSPFELKFDDAIYYDERKGHVVQKYANSETIHTESETTPERSDTDPPCKVSSSTVTTESASTKNLDIRDYEHKFRSILQKYPHGVFLKDFLKEYEEENGEPLDVTKFGYQQPLQMLYRNPDIFLFEKPFDSDEITVYDAKCTGRYCPIANRRWVPSYMQDGLATLTKAYPNGIGINDLVSLYKEKYSTDINPEALGYKSITHLLKECSSVCFKKYDDTCLVFPKYWIGFPMDNSQLLDAGHPSVKEKIKYLWNNHYKPNECDPSFKYSPPILPEDDMVQVKIVDVVNPDHFWIQFTKNIGRLADLMFQMTMHYEMEKADYRLPDQFVGPGLAVAVVFEGFGWQWHRARIESIEGDDAEIFYVDFGTVETRKLSDLRKLDRRFGQDPMYAVKASMYRLRPPNETNEWPAEAYDFLFENYCLSDIIMYALICLRDTREPDSPSVEVVLYRTNRTKEEEIVNETFLKKNLAWDKMQAAEPVVTETVTLNESNIDIISKLLPVWLTTSKTDAHNVVTTMTNLKSSTEWDSCITPIDSLEEPCCLRHLAQRFFQANPVRMSQLWEAAYLTFEGMLLQHIGSSLSLKLDEYGWNSHQCWPVSCCGSPASKEDVVLKVPNLPPSDCEPEKGLNVTANPHPPPSDDSPTHEYFPSLDEMKRTFSHSVGTRQR